MNVFLKFVNIRELALSDNLEIMQKNILIKLLDSNQYFYSVGYYK